MRYGVIGGLVLLLFGLVAPLAAQTDQAVCVATIDGIINPAIADYVDRVVGQAEKGSCSSLIVQLNTPGGLTTSTWEIGEDLLNAELPTVVYITPQGANAGSAGVFITYAAHIAAMAPNATIGAAHPVAGDGGDLGAELDAKITNDAVARITTWAQAHDRNAAWAEQAVRSSVSVGSAEALELGVINLVAADQAALLQELDGMVVSLADGSTSVLATANLPARSLSMSWIESILHWLGDPTIATLLISLGSLAIYFELAIPGIGISGISGFLALALGLYGMSVLPINVIGAGLLGLAFVLFAVDIFATNHGALSIGGVAAFVIGALILIDGNAAPGVEVSRMIIAGLALGILVVVGLIMYIMRQTRDAPDATGRDALIGSLVPVRSTIAPEGMVFADGSLWKARSVDQLTVGEQAEVVAVEGLTLVVRRPQVQLVHG